MYIISDTSKSGADCLDIGEICDLPLVVLLASDIHPPQRRKHLVNLFLL